MEIPRFLRRGRCVKPIIAEETGRGKRFFDGVPYSALADQPVEIKEPAPCLLTSTYFLQWLSIGIPFPDNTCYVYTEPCI